MKNSRTEKPHRPEIFKILSQKGKKFLLITAFWFLCFRVSAQTCTIVKSIPATKPTSGAVSKLGGPYGSFNYSIAGTAIYDSYDSRGNGKCAMIAATNHFWINYAHNNSAGPLNRCGVWIVDANNRPLFHSSPVGFSVCVDISAAKDYYMGFAADNFATLKIDAKEVISQTQTTGIANFNYWKVFKISLSKGKHYVEITGTNPPTDQVGNVGIIGFEIYDNTADQIAKAASYKDLNLVFSTKDQVGMPVQEGDPSLTYSCPIGFSLDYCSSDVPVCSQILPVELIVTNPAPACSSAGADITVPEVTKGSSAVLDYTYWQDNLATVPLENPSKIMTSGTYYIMGKTPDGCTQIKPVKVVVNQSAARTIDTAICFGSSYMGYTKSGTYKDAFTAADGCDSIRTLNLTVKALAQLTIDTTICYGSSFLGYSKSGTYVDTFPAANGCDSIRTLNLTVRGQLMPDLGQNKVLCFGDSIILNPGTFSRYLWQDNSTKPSFKVTAAGTYWVRVFNENGCEAADTIVIKKGYCAIIKIPNTFTPNGDGINDRWDIYDLQYYPACSVMVYNRWGQVVFKSTGYSKPWDGNYNSKAMPAGTYYYVINLGNNTPDVAGPITIIR